MLEAHPPPLVDGRRLRIRYMTQIKTRPPTFALFVSRPADLPESYLRYLTAGLRADFGLDGVPIRLVMRKRENPFAPS
jgi:GTP-binding protein